MQNYTSEQDRSSLCVWLVPHIDPEKRVLWAWAEDVIFFLPDPPRTTTAEARASIEREAKRLQLQGEVLRPGEVPLLDSDYEQSHDEPEDVAGKRLLADQPERLVRGFIRVHQTDTPNQWHYQAANAALVCEGLDVETNISTRNELAEALRAECCRVRVPDGAGLAELNAMATDVVERVSGEPREHFRKDVQGRPFFWWAESVPERGANQIRWPRALAQELRRRTIREAGERAERLARNPSAGIAMPYLTQLVSASRFGRSSSKMQRQIDGEWAVLDTRGRKVAWFVPPQLVDDAGTAHIMAALSRLSVTRVMRWAVWTAYWQRFQLERENPHALFMPGGVSGLAQALGLEPSGSTREELVLALEALASIRIDTPRSDGRVFSWNERKAVGRRGAVLDAVVFGPLRPDYIDDTTPRSDERKLVPIPLPEHLPAFVGRSNEHPAQANLQLLVMRHFRKNARHFAEHGSVELSRDELRRLLDESGTSTRLLDDVLNAYFTGEGTAPGPPQLVSIGPGVVDLHPGAFGHERASIIAAGQKSKQGKANREGKANRARRRTPGE